MRAVNRAAGDHPITLTATTLAKRLWERKLLCRRESLDRLTVQVVLHGTRRRVLHMRADILIGLGKPGKPESNDDAEAPNADSALNSCPGPEDGDLETGARDCGGGASTHASERQHRVDAPSAPVAPVIDDGIAPRSGRDIKPGPPYECFACKRVRWFTTATNGGKDWQCGACHPPVESADIVWWEGNEERST